MLARNNKKMTIKLQISLEKGWKAEERKRFGEVVVIKFIDSNTNKTLFEYAPRCEDNLFWREIFGILKIYDDALKQIREKMKELNEFKEIIE